MGFPLPCLVDEVLHPRHQVPDAARQLCIGHVPHRVEDFQLAHAEPQAGARGGLVDVPAVGAGGPCLAGLLCSWWRGRSWCFRTARRLRTSGNSSCGRGETAGRVRCRTGEQGQRTAVQLDRQGMRAELGAVGGVGARALRRQAVGLLPALHARRAIRVEGVGMGEDQCQRLVQAIGQDLDVEFRPQLPVFSAKYPPVHARERARKSLPGGVLRAGEGVRSAP